MVFDRFACKDIELACIQQRTIDHNMVTDSFKVLPEFPDIFSSARLTSIPMSRAPSLPKPLGRRALQPGWLLQWWASWILSSSPLSVDTRTLILMKCPKLLDLCCLLIDLCWSWLINLIDIDWLTDWFTSFIECQLLCLWCSRSLLRWDEGNDWSQRCLSFLKFSLSQSKQWQCPT